MQLNTWDAKFLVLAYQVSMWSKDPSTQCGAVIARPDKTVASLGFNGFPRGIPDEHLENREYKLERIIHAEMNALLFLREPAHGYTLYTWPFGPCCRCATHVIQAGITRVVAPSNPPERWHESLHMTRELLKQANVSFEEFEKIC